MQGVRCLIDLVGGFVNVDFDIVELVLSISKDLVSYQSQNEGFVLPVFVAVIIVVIAVIIVTIIIVMTIIIVILIILAILARVLF